MNYSLLQTDNFPYQATIDQWSELIGINPLTLWRWRKNGRLTEGTTVGNVLLYSKTQILEALKA